MKLLDEGEERWYCFKDNEIYYAKEQSWDRKVEEASPKIIDERKELTRRGKVLRLVAALMVGIGAGVIGVSLGFPPQIVAPVIGAGIILPIVTTTLSSSSHTTVPKTVLNGVGVLGVMGFVIAIFTLLVGVLATFSPVPGAAWGTAVGLQFLAVTFILIAASIIMIKKGRRPYEPGLVFQKIVRRHVCPIHQFGMSYEASKNRYVCPKCEANHGSLAPSATGVNQQLSRSKVALTARKKIVVVVVSMVVLLLTVILLLVIHAQPTAQLTDVQATMYANFTQDYGLPNNPIIPSGLYTQGSANVPISGSGTIILSQVAMTLDGNPIGITRIYAQGWDSPLGHTLQLPVELSINFYWDDWPNLTTHPSSTLVVTITGDWSSSTSGTPNNPITLTAEENVQWTMTGPSSS